MREPRLQAWTARIRGMRTTWASFPEKSSVKKGLIRAARADRRPLLSQFALTAKSLSPGGSQGVVELVSCAVRQKGKWALSEAR